MGRGAGLNCLVACDRQGAAGDRRTFSTHCRLSAGAKGEARLLEGLIRKMPILLMLLHTCLPMYGSSQNRCWQGQLKLVCLLHLQAFSLQLLPNGLHSGGCKGSISPVATLANSLQPRYNQ